MDMHIVNTLLYNLSRYYIGSKVLLSDDKTGNIVYIPPGNICKPIVDTGMALWTCPGKMEFRLHLLLILLLPGGDNMGKNWNYPKIEELRNELNRMVRGTKTTIRAKY